MIRSRYRKLIRILDCFVRQLVHIRSERHFLAVHELGQMVLIPSQDSPYCAQFDRHWHWRSVGMHSFDPFR